jgi:hypothetical protein
MTTSPSTADWPQFWREQSLRDGTDWPSLRRQLVEAWRRLRSLAEVSS